MVIFQIFKSFKKFWEFWEFESFRSLKISWNLFILKLDYLKEVLGIMGVIVFSGV